jgi:hypothetical protein
MHFAKYLRAAFLHRWNLLALLAGSAFALLSRRPELLLPVVVAGEAAFVGLLATRRKFQHYVDAQEAKAGRGRLARAGEQGLQHIYRTLPKELLQRFQALRGQCLELRQIAADLKGPDAAEHEQPLEDLQLAALDRLLWIHLRLLYTKHALGHFLQRTSEEQIRKEIDKLQKRIGELPDDAGDPRRQRMLAALVDNLETSRQRLDNLSKARDNYQVIDVEIERLENRLRSLCEMAVNRQEPEFITGEVDHVAASMVDTERTMNELQFAAGFSTLDNEPPDLLRGKTALVK